MRVRFDELDVVVDNKNRDALKVFLENSEGDVVRLNFVEPQMGDVLPCDGVGFLFSAQHFDHHDPVVDMMLQFASANPDACMGVVAD